MSIKADKKTKGGKTPFESTVISLYIHNVLPPPFSFYCDGAVLYKAKRTQFHVLFYTIRFLF
jgi:hypothetical protein